MAISVTIPLEAVGLAIEAPVYVSLQHVTVVQLKDRETAEVRWVARASALVFASRDAKYAGKMPLDNVPVEAAVEFATQDVFGALYSALKAMPRFASAVDV